MSAFAWLDYSEHDRRLALDVIDQFKEQETRDELGLGAIRDGFADLFFPGTGTVQTRARYFFFVPWIYQRLEERKVSSAEVKHRARKAECELIEALLDSGEQEGVIGRLRRDKLKRLPSSIYWQGLGVLGIRRFPGSQDQYHRSLDRFYRTGGLDIRADDRELLNRASAYNWHPSLPKPPAGFPKGATLTLTQEEAEFLKERISYESPRSLFRFLADLPGSPEVIDFPWDHTALKGAPAHLTEQLEHARHFSEVMHGASLLYNLILAQKKEDDARIGEYSDALQNWVNVLKDRKKALGAWDLKRFWEIVRESHANITEPTKRFVERWIAFSLGPGAPSVTESEAARRLVSDREIQLKRGQARVNSRRALELWQGASGTRRLTYRWEIANRMLVDMHNARAGGR
jgi:hypothetical protein